MNIREAVGEIIGQRLADSIIADQGIDWAVVAAMAEAKVSDNPQALAAINAYNAERPNAKKPPREGRQRE